MATGFTGDPVPPGTRNGATTIINSQRLRRAAVSAASSRSRLSRRFIPRDTIANLWIGLTLRPGTLPGASCTESAPMRAISRSARNGMTDASQPDISRVGPVAARRAQRPVRSKSASPEPNVTPANSSHASMSS